MRTQLHFWDLPKEVELLVENETDFKPVNEINEDYEKYVRKIRSSHRGNPIEISFPINFLSVEWASIVGALLSEGNINKENLEVGFWNINEELFKKYTELVGNAVKSGMRIDKSNYGCFLPKVMGKILVNNLQFTSGNKVSKDIGIPKIYMNISDEKIIGALLKWLFSGDGWVTTFKDHLGQIHRDIGIGFGSSEKDKIPKLLTDTMILLDKLDIKYNKPHERMKKTKKGEITYSWQIFIKGKDNLVKFREKISFVTEEKQAILNNMISSYTRPKLGDNESLKMVTSSVKKLNELNLDASKHSISELTKLRVNWIERILTRATEDNLLIVIGGGHCIKGLYAGKSPYIYSITEKGENFIRNSS